MAKRLTIFNVPGNPDELFEMKHSLMDPVMMRKAPEYGGVMHIAARNPDGSGIIIVNVWDSPEGSDAAFEDPEVQEVQRQLMERTGLTERPAPTHYEIVDLVQADQPATAA